MNLPVTAGGNTTYLQYLLGDASLIKSQHVNPLSKLSCGDAT